VSVSTSVSFDAPFQQLPAEVLRLPLETQIQQLETAYGVNLYPAFDPDVRISAPCAQETNTEWLKFANTVGINVRTIRNFWNIIPYSMTLPPAQNAIHILPLWEPGVVASLYGPSSWNVNPEFYNPELASAFSHLNTVEAQLKVVINLLHLMGKSVGMDVVPHTDRFSEMVLANPACFEWLQRKEYVILKHGNTLYQEIEALLWYFLENEGSVSAELPLPATSASLFQEMPENDRLKIMFGAPNDYAGRLYRRKKMVRLLYDAGYETVPATMGPPYRGLEVDPNPAAKVTDEDGLVWLDYRITQPESFSRVFGPLTRYKLYESKNDNQDWELDFSRPNKIAWEYACQHYRDFQAGYNFDFMRGDMSHVQMRPQGVPPLRDNYYDLLGAVKQTVLKEKPYFGYFAESFMAPPGIMAYGDECDHLEASFADTTLGDLQSEPLGTEHFVREFARYRHWLETRKFAPCFTILTADKDDPRFDGFYLKGNELRYFMALFLTDMPSYMALGFECRDIHYAPAPNEMYTKLYVFQVEEGPKMTRGPYQWGQNLELHQNLARIKQRALDILPNIQDACTKWIQAPDPSGKEKNIIWTQENNSNYIFIANLDLETTEAFSLVLPADESWVLHFSTERELPGGLDWPYREEILPIAPGEGLILKRV
jgi:hypothetical protein